GIGELRRNPGQRTDGHGRRLCISAGILPTRDFPVRAVDEDAFATRVAVVATSTEPADGYTIADRELFDALAEFGYRSGDFVPQRQRPRQPGEAAVGEVEVGTTYAACGDRYPYLVADR